MATHGNCIGPDSQYITLISSDGHEFTIARELGLLSTTIKAMLTGPGQYGDDQVNEVNFRDIPSHVLMKIVHYFQYKDKYSDASTEIPEFPLEADGTLEILMAANFLEC